MKRQLNKWGEIFANDMTNKEWIFKIYKCILQLNILKIKRPELTFSQKAIQMTSSYVKRCLISLLKKCKSKPKWDITEYLSV